MSIEEVIAKLEEMAEDREDKILPGCLGHDEIEPLREAAALLKSHPDSQPNEPLTLEELKKMDGQPVYLALDKKWYIVSVNYEPPRGEAQPCGIDLWGAGTSLRLLAKCGMYRRPPKED